MKKFVAQELLDYFPVRDFCWAVGLHGSLERVVLEPMVVDFLRSCIAFDAIERHLQRFQLHHQYESGEMDLLRSAVPMLLKHKFFIEQEEAVRRCLKASDVTAHEPLERLALISKDRPDLVARSLNVFCENASRHGRKLRIAVCDGSTTAENEEATRIRMVEGVAGRVAEAWWLPWSRREDYAAKLAKEADVNPATTAFAIADPLQIGFAAGANRNAALLHWQGQRLVCADNDLIDDVRVTPDREPRLELFSNFSPVQRRIFSDVEELRAQTTKCDVDLLGMHEKALGHSIPSIARLTETEKRLSIAFSNYGLHSRAMDKDARVKVTISGVTGDSGIRYSGFLLDCNDKVFADLTRSEKIFNSALASPVMELRSPAWVLGKGDFCLGCFIGHDGTEYFPPALPVTHAEDVVSGQVWERVMTKGLVCNMPMAIGHFPSEKMRNVISPKDIGSGTWRWAFFEMMTAIVQSTPSSTLSSNAVICSRVVGAYLRGLGELKLKEFSLLIESMQQDYLSNFLHRLERLYVVRSEAPAYWKETMNLQCEQVQRAILSPNPVPVDLDKYGSAETALVKAQAIVRNYGALLEAWPTLWEANARLRERGVYLGERIV